MKIIYLNSWQALAGDSFFDFVGKNSNDTDIFGLSEVNPQMHDKIQTILSNHNGYHDKGDFDSTLNLQYGQSIFCKKGLNFEKLAKINNPLQAPFDSVLSYSLVFSISNKDFNFLVTNVHGKTLPGDKLDTPARLTQSQDILNFLEKFNLPKIVGGDFNLFPDTKAVRMFEEFGYRNLIRDFGIQETRNRLTWEQFPNEEKQHFADYCFITPDVKVKKFEVPDAEISDHLPLILEFEL